MDVIQVYVVAGAVLTGAALGFVLAGIVRSGGTAEADAEADRLRALLVRAEGQTKIERSAVALKQAECDELARQLKAAELKERAAQEAAEGARALAKSRIEAVHAATGAAYAAEKEADAARRRVKALEKEVERLRRKHKDVKKTMRRKRKIRDVAARGAKRMNRRPFPNPGSGSRRSKFQRQAFTMDEGQIDVRTPVVKPPSQTHTIR